MNEKFYKANFIFFEIGFIVLAVPVLVITLISIPIAMYFVIVKDFRLWPFIAIAIVITFFQIFAIKSFIKKFYLDQYNMTFGEFLRMRYEDRKAKIVDDKTRELKTWYDNLDEFIIKVKTEQREQTFQIYATKYEDITLIN